MSRLTCPPTSSISFHIFSLAPATLAFQFPKGTKSSHWGLQRCTCAFLSVWNAPVHNPWTIPLHCLGNSIYLQATLSQRNLANQNQVLLHHCSSHSLLFLVYTNPTYNHLSFRTVITNNNYTFTIICLIGQFIPQH